MEEEIETTTFEVGDDGQFVKVVKAVSTTSWKFVVGGLVFTGKPKPQRSPQKYKNPHILINALKDFEHIDYEKHAGHLVRTELKAVFVKHSPEHDSKGPIDTIVSLLGCVRQMDLSNWYLAECIFSGRGPLDLSYAVLHGINFSHAMISDMDFSHADLSGAKFAHTDFTDVRFDDATLVKTDFTGARFYRSDLTTAKVMTGAKIDEELFEKHKDEFQRKGATTVGLPEDYSRSDKCDVNDESFWDM